MNDATRPAVGQPAPGFSLPTDGGRTLSLAELLGSAVVLYFYPKDDTSGCTREALDFTANLAEFAAIRTVVIGVSKDPVKTHDKFIEKHGITVTLVSDADSNLCECYGTWIEKSMYGRRYMGIERATFLIDAIGILRREWRKVEVPCHATKVLLAARAL